MASFKRVVGVAGQVLRYEDRGQTTEIRDHDVHCFLDLQPLPFHLLPFLIAHCVVLGLYRILASYETRRGVTKFLESRCVAGPGTRNAVSSWAGKFPIPAASAHRNGPQVQASTVHHRCISISASSRRHSEVQTVTVERASTDGSIVEVLDHVLDKGIVIDARVRVALLSIGSPHGPGARGWAACWSARQGNRTPPRRRMLAAPVTGRTSSSTVVRELHEGSRLRARRARKVTSGLTKHRRP